MAMVASRGPFRNLMGHILFVRADFSMETRPGEGLQSIYRISLCPPEEKFQSFTGRSLYRKSSGANYAEEAAELLLNLP